MFRPAPPVALLALTVVRLMMLGFEGLVTNSPPQLIVEKLSPHVPAVELTEYVPAAFGAVSVQPIRVTKSAELLISTNEG
jgi:hypothetical protein